MASYVEQAKLRQRAHVKRERQIKGRFAIEPAGLLGSKNTPPDVSASKRAERVAGYLPRRDGFVPRGFGKRQVCGSRLGAAERDALMVRQAMREEFFAALRGE